MPKKGDVREDGKVFVHFSKQWGEYWTTREKFLEVHGADWFEKRARMDANVAARREATARRIARDEAIAARPPKKKRPVFATEEERSRHFSDWEYRRNRSPKRLAWLDQRKAKHQAAVAERKAERARIREEKQAAKNEARRVRAEKTAENKRLKALKPKRERVILTEAQRKEAKRQEKRNYKHRRRALLRNQEAKATPKQIESLRKKAKGKCYYCRAKAPLTLDHILAIGKGGTHTLDNIVFACHGCNSEKRDLCPNEYAGKHGLLIV